MKSNDNDDANGKTISALIMVATLIVLVTWTIADSFAAKTFGLASAFALVGCAVFLIVKELVAQLFPLNAMPEKPQSHPRADKAFLMAISAVLMAVVSALLVSRCFTEGEAIAVAPHKSESRILFAFRVRTPICRMPLVRAANSSIARLQRE